jgi:hypothetical protein
MGGYTSIVEWEDMALKIATVTIDCADPAPIARWWAVALGWRVTYEDKEEWVIEPPEGDEYAAPLLFCKAPDEKTLKNRLHLDLRPEDRDAEVARLEGLGARQIDIGQGEPTWVVMQDPFGNEFCILRALTPEELAEGKT